LAIQLLHSDEADSPLHLAPSTSYTSYEYTSRSVEHNEICFLDRSNSYCVSVVDIVDSTAITMDLSNAREVKAYYTIFLNAMSTIAKNFGAEIIKNIGDALVFYYPLTSDHGNRDAFKDVLECSTALIAARDIVNMKLHLEMLPPISYRVSADYGVVEIASSATSHARDLFGSTMNICAKINSKAEPNGIVIGSELYRLMKSLSFQEYLFKEIEGYHVANHLYPLYSLTQVAKPRAKKEEEDSIKKNSFKSKAALELFPGVEVSDTSAYNPIGKNDYITKSDIILSEKEKQNLCRIMLVDDDCDILSVFEWVLADDGFSNVEVFSDPYKALESFSTAEKYNNHYGLVILDIRMPSMNGLQLYQRLRATNKELRVIFLSALEATEELVTVLEGVKSFDILKKPVDNAHFLKKVRESIKV
jgi:two-component system response regulator ChvI